MAKIHASGTELEEPRGVWAVPHSAATYWCLDVLASSGSVWDEAPGLTVHWALTAEPHRQARLSGCYGDHG